MRLWRVCSWLPDARPGEPGHALYAPVEQGGGRIDNPEHYRVAYLAESAEAAIGEALGRFDRWDDRVLLTGGRLPGGLKALACVETDAVPLDLDDPVVLADYQLRPSRVVTRRRELTQAWALRLWRERRWPGVRWWSALDADWGVVGLWDREQLALAEVRPLRLDDPALLAAADRLHRMVG